jgi:hypothetical protein
VVSGYPTLAITSSSACHTFPPPRQKLTKLAANKDARRSLNKEMRSLVKEQLGISNKGRSSEASKAGGSGEQPAAGGGGGGDTMAE